MVLFFTLCCLVCSSVNDLLFKFFARKERSRGLFVMMVGIVGTVCCIFLPDKIGENFQATLLWGVICGIVSAVGNILLIESMSTLSAGICSTIYRLNLALVVPFSLVFFHERLIWTQYLGIFFAIAAVLAFFPSGEKKSSAGSNKNVLLPLIMILTASVFRAGLGLGCKYSTMIGASPNGVSVMIEIIWIFSGLIYYLIRERTRFTLDAKLVKYSIVSGLLVACILFFMIQALKYKDGNASVVLPIAQMSFIVTFLLSVIFLKEKVTGWKLTAMICGFAAMILLSWK